MSRNNKGLILCVSRAFLLSVMVLLLCRARGARVRGDAINALRGVAVSRAIPNGRSRR